MQIDVELMVYLGVRRQYVGGLPSLLAYPSLIEPSAILSIEIRNSMVDFDQFIVSKISLNNRKKNATVVEVGKRGFGIDKK